MDADDVSLLNRSPRWEPGPACFSSCRSFFTEAATQRGGCRASTFVIHRWLTTDVALTSRQSVSQLANSTV